MSPIIASVIRRHMKHVPAFQQGSALPSELVLAFAEGESVEGWYRNPAPYENEILIFTDQSVWSVRGSDSSRLRWSDIVGYESPSSKSELSGIRVRTDDGLRFLRMAGSHGPDNKYKDVFSLIMIVRTLST